jgi:hypothetical protein
VTAKHNLAKASGYGDLYLRLNGVSQSEEDSPGLIYFRIEEWFTSDTADVAAAFLPRIGGIEAGLIPQFMFATADVVVANGIGIGDEVVVAGLFPRHSGTHRNEPIVRSGIIAATPNEPIRDTGGQAYPGYLIEVRSFGGLSGSPVIAMLESHRTPTGKIDDVHRATFLLGLIRGHWDYPVLTPPGSFDPDEVRALNMGMAIVTPVEEMVNLLNRPDVAAHRATRVRRTGPNT